MLNDFQFAELYIDLTLVCFEILFLCITSIQLLHLKKIVNSSEGIYESPAAQFCYNLFIYLILANILRFTTDILALKDLKLRITDIFYYSIVPLDTINFIQTLLSAGVFTILIVFLGKVFTEKSVVDILLQGAIQARIAKDFASKFAVRSCGICIIIQAVFVGLAPILLRVSWFQTSSIQFAIGIVATIYTFYLTSRTNIVLKCIKNNKSSIRDFQKFLSKCTWYAGLTTLSSLLALITYKTFTSYELLQYQELYMLFTEVPRNICEIFRSYFLIRSLPLFRRFLYD